METQRQLGKQVVGPAYLPGTDTREPDSQRDRSNQVSRRDDTVAVPYVGIGDIDEALIWYFNNVIKPQVRMADGSVVQVPLVYANPEKWQAVQKEGYYRDKDGKRQIPVIVFKRESLDHDRKVTSKVDANYPHNFYVTAVTKPGQRNYYDRFDIIKTRQPEKAYVVTVVPDYVTITYSCTILTDFIYQMNPIIESINFASDSWWGPEDRFKFQSFIDSFKTDMLSGQSEDRVVKTTFSIKLHGYILPKQSVNANPYTTIKRYKKTKAVVGIKERIGTSGEILPVKISPNTGTIITNRTEYVYGLSAYDIAVRHGFVGTEAEWLASLKGEPGTPGEDAVVDCTLEQYAQWKASGEIESNKWYFATDTGTGKLYIYAGTTLVSTSESRGMITFESPAVREYFKGTVLNSVLFSWNSTVLNPKSTKAFVNGVEVLLQNPSSYTEHNVSSNTTFKVQIIDQDQFLIENSLTLTFFDKMFIFSAVYSTDYDNMFAEATALKSKAGTYTTYAGQQCVYVAVPTNRTITRVITANGEPITDDFVVVESSYSYQGQIYKIYRMGDSTYLPLELSLTITLA